VDIPELEKSILDIGGNINYKHFYIPEPSEDHDSSAGKERHLCTYTHMNFIAAWCTLYQ
jgi:hypothetical protein